MSMARKPLNGGRGAAPSMEINTELFRFQLRRPTAGGRWSFAEKEITGFSCWRRFFWDEFLIAQVPRPCFRGIGLYPITTVYAPHRGRASGSSGVDFLDMNAVRFLSLQLFSYRPTAFSPREIS